MTKCHEHVNISRIISNTLFKSTSRVKFMVVFHLSFQYQCPDTQIWSPADYWIQAFCCCIFDPFRPKQTNKQNYMPMMWQYMPEMWQWCDNICQRCVVIPDLWHYALPITAEIKAPPPLLVMRLIPLKPPLVFWQIVFSSSMCLYMCLAACIDEGINPICIDTM